MDQYRYGPRKWTKKQRQRYEARKKLKNRKRGRPAALAVARWAFDRDYLARRASWKDRPNWVRRKLRLAAKHVLLVLTGRRPRQAVPGGLPTGVLGKGRQVHLHLLPQDRDRPPESEIIEKVSV